ncbi:MAG TPA: hypothetical protein VE967_18185 [Gemmatimonadaceae bacterium]|nr:hypothetical protein [Gemmatimonadaceae bacterium]
MLHVLFALSAMGADTTTAKVRADSAREEVVITVAGITLPGGVAYDHHGNDSRAYFTWPVRGTARGFRVDLLDSAGRSLPRLMLHHAGIANFSRRQLAYPMVERMFAAGRETRPVLLPDGYGVPIDSDAELGLYYALVNPADTAITGASLRVTIRWTPEPTGARKPTLLYPIGLGANADFVSTRMFDVPPGRSVSTADVVLPISGWIRAMSAHAHDYVVELRLEDVETGKTLLAIHANRDGRGALKSLPTETFRFSRHGLAVTAGRRYRVVSIYDNPTADTLHSGAMAFLAGVFIPRDARAWPAIDASDPVFAADAAVMRGISSAGASATHHHGQMK